MGALVSADPNNVALGKAVVIFREANSLTQEELAERSKLSVEELGEIERGEVEALWCDLRHISAALKIQLPQLLALEEKIADRQEWPPPDERKQS